MRRYLDLPTGQVHVRVAGSGGEDSLLLLHRVTSSSWFWDPVIPLFAREGYQVIAPDLPGYGLSDSPAEEPTLEWYADIARRVAEAFGALTPWVLGNHTGASVALQYAASFSDALRGVILWGLPFYPAETRVRFAQEAEPTYDPEGVDIAHWWKWNYSSAGRGDGQAVATRAVGELMLCGRARPLGHRALGRVDHEPLLRRVTKPTLLIDHARDVLVEETRRASALVKGAEYVELADGTPALTDDDPSRFVSEVHSFIGRRRRPMQSTSVGG